MLAVWLNKGHDPELIQSRLFNRPMHRTVLISQITDLEITGKSLKEPETLSKHV
jgi:hypothetical protein